MEAPLYESPPFSFKGEVILKVAKGQLILKGLFGVFNSSKKRMQKRHFGLSDQFLLPKNVISF
jgi:hypothetical protein